jgi:L-ascorbate metabolism protein UlaG (beta-lactamase superfamily)
VSSVTWLGHSTVVIELDGARFITDPILTRRVGHLRRADDVPQAARDGIDVVLVSHVHLDHLHVRSLRRIERAATLVIPRHAGSIVRRLGFAEVREVVPGDLLELGGVTVEVTPAEHGEVRRFIRERAPAVGFALRGSASVYFAGDTDRFPQMAEIAPVDVALLPIAGWGPRLPPGHLDARGAAAALRLLRPRIAVPVHWGTLCGPFKTWDEAPAAEFVRLAAALAPDVTVRVLAIGETLQLQSLTPIGRCPGPRSAVRSRSQPARR